MHEDTDVVSIPGKIIRLNSVTMLILTVAIIVLAVTIGVQVRSFRRLEKRVDANVDRTVRLASFHHHPDGGFTVEEADYPCVVK